MLITGSLFVIKERFKEYVKVVVKGKLINGKQIGESLKGGEIH